VLLNSYNVSKRQKDMGDNENRERENLLIRSFLYHAEPYIEKVTKLDSQVIYFIAYQK